MAGDPVPYEAFRKIKDELKKVKEIWSKTPYGWEAKEILKAWARQNLEPYYEVCAEGSADKYIECLRKVALMKNLHATYRQFWDNA